MMTKNRKRVLELEVRLNDALQFENFYRRKCKELKAENERLKRQLIKPLFTMDTSKMGDQDALL